MFLQQWFWRVRRTAKLLVPVSNNFLWHLKLTKATRFATDSKERLQRLTIQSSARHFLAVVGHEIDHEVVSTSGDDRGDGPGKVVRVVENRPSRVVVAVCGSLSL